MAQKTWLGTTDGNYGTAGNWAEGSIPTSKDAVTISSAAVNGLTSGLDQSAVAIDTFVVEEGFGYDIGTSLAYLQIACTGTGANFLKYAGAGGLAKIDVAASAIPVEVRNTGSPAVGSYGLELLGDNLTIVTVYRGNVGIGVLPGDTTTNVNTVECLYLFPSTRATDSTITVGSGVTDNTGTPEGVDFRQSGGTIYAHCDTDNVSCTDGEYHQVDGIYDTGTFTGNSQIFYENNGTGTLATTKLYGTSIARILTQYAQTFTNLTLNSGSTWEDLEYKGVYSNGFVITGASDSVSIRIGVGRTLTPS